MLYNILLFGNYYFFNEEKEDFFILPGDVKFILNYKKMGFFIIMINLPLL